MRTIVAVATGISILLLGVRAISQQAQQAAPGANNSAAYNASYNTSVGVFEGISLAGGPGIVWFGVAAIVLVACGFLVVSSRGGGR